MPPSFLTIEPPPRVRLVPAAPAGALPFPLGHTGFQLFAKGRHALWHGVRALGLERGDGVLVPAYHHGSEVEALQRAGLRCVFYRIDREVRPVERDLERLVDRRTRALHLTHYLGFPQDSLKWRAWCDDRGLFLIEDAAQAWLSSTRGQPVGAIGHCAIFSFYKTLPLPDGGGLVCRDPRLQTMRRRGIALREVRAVAPWLIERFTQTTPEWAPSPSSSNAASDFVLGDPSRSPAGVTKWLLRLLAHDDVAARRRENYRRLLSTISEFVPSAFASVPSGASPFVFPVQTAAKSRLLRHLRGHRIGGLNFWSVPHPSVSPQRCSVATRLRSTLVGLPVHQELKPRDLDRIASAAWAFLANDEQSRSARM
jgi:dTDP-4-amino-4,6-dideoxygalactose transaminase